jgi:hypothetical protein
LASTKSRHNDNKRQTSNPVEETKGLKKKDGYAMEKKKWVCRERERQRE